jgi:amidohydrolase
MARGPGDPLKGLLDEARALLPGAVSLRRAIHAEPELGLENPATRAAVLAALDGLDLEIRESARTSGLVATLHGGLPGPTLLLRADTDALPMPEDTGLEYASRRDGRMHACGHDAHTAMLASAARLLHGRRQGLAGAVRVMFQPGEEGYAGARVMLEEGLLDGEGAVDAAFAIHVDPRLPVGRVASRPGPLLAAADVWSVDLHGRGGHASMPHDTIDPVPVACEIALALQTFVTRRFDVFDPVVLSVTKIDAGTANNVIPERAHLLGTLRSTSERARARAHEGLRRVAERVAAAHEVDAQVHVLPGYPVTVNDAGFAGLAARVTRELLGDGSWIEMPAPVMGAEDFSYVLQRVPGAMVFLGVRPEGDAQPAPCHSNRMRLNEEGMAAGIALHAAVALRWLGEAAAR